MKGQVFRFVAAILVVGSRLIVTPSEGALFSALSRKEARSRYPHRARCAAGDVPAAGPDVSQSHHGVRQGWTGLNAIIMINPNALPNANALDAKFAIRFCRPPATVYALTGHQAMVPPTTCTPITSADAHKIDEMLRRRRNALTTSRSSVNSPARGGVDRAPLAREPRIAPAELIHRPTHIRGEDARASRQRASGAPPAEVRL